MYTRCPSCRAEICFQPPANAANLPDGYKHRIKCPSCGVTIGVKLPNRDAIASVQPTFTPQNPNAYSPEPIYNAGAATVAQDDKQARREARALANANKKTGLSRNIAMLVFAVLLLACSVVGYFVSQGNIDLEILGGLAFFDGVNVLKDIAANGDTYSMLFDASIANGLLTVLPAIFFLATLLVAAIAIVSMFIKKYGRLLNLILALGLTAVSACILFAPFVAAEDGMLGGTASLLYILALGEDGALSIGNYFMNLIEAQFYLILVPMALGIIHIIASLVCLKSMKKKVA